MSETGGVTGGIDAQAVPGWRTAYGESLKLWAGGRHEVEPDWWLAFSGVRSADYNLVLCHGDGPGGLNRGLAEVQAANVPAVIIVAGAALGMTNVLATAGWVCVGASPFMVMTDVRGHADPDVRRLRPAELPAAQQMISDTYNMALPFAETALPTVSEQSPTREAWGLFEAGELVSCMAAVTVGETICYTTLATRSDRQRRGLGRRLYSAMLAAGRDAGATLSLIFNPTPAAEPLYRSLGYEVVEYWQMWSRARWVFPPV